MNITQIRYFLTLARYLNFTRAANSLYVTQPALSRQIQMMEEELGCILFIRNSRKMQLTPSGDFLYKEFDRIYNEYTLAVAKARNVYQGLSGEINVGILEGTRVWDLFPDVLFFFQKNHPNVEIKMQNYSFSKLLELLNSGELDFIITLKFDVENKEGISYKIIEHTKDHIVMHKDHRLAGARKVKLKDFAEDIFIMVSTEDSVESPKLILDGFRREGVMPRIRFAPNIRTEMLWVQAGVGVCMLDSRNELTASSGVVFAEVDGVSDPSLVLAWNDKNSNPYRDLFIEHFTYYE